jgi:tetratricopeptide (TPR) repeat protein
VANAVFETAKRMEGASGVEVERAMAATLPFLQVPAADLGHIRTELEGFDPNAGSGMPGGLAGSLRPHLRLYLLSLLSSRMGDDEKATRYATELEALAAPAEAAAVTRALAQTARADVALRNGKPAEALALLERVQGDVPLELVYLKAFATVREFGQEHARYLRAEALMRLRRYDDALRWYQTSFQGSPAELVYLAPVHLREGQIFEARGEREKAAAHYRRFIALWGNADPSLTPMVKDARDRLSRLGGSRSPSP